MTSQSTGVYGGSWTDSRNGVLFKGGEGRGRRSLHRPSSPPAGAMGRTGSLCVFLLALSALCAQARYSTGVGGEGRRRVLIEVWQKWRFFKNLFIYSFILHLLIEYFYRFRFLNKNKCVCICMEVCSCVYVYESVLFMHVCICVFLCKYAYWGNPYYW